MWESPDLNGQFPSLPRQRYYSRQHGQRDYHSFYSIDFEWRIDWSALNILNFGTFGL